MSDAAGYRWIFPGNPFWLGETGGDSRQALEREIIYELTWSSQITWNLLENDSLLSGIRAKPFTVTTNVAFSHGKPPLNNRTCSPLK